MPPSLAGERQQESTIVKLRGTLRLVCPLTEATRSWRLRRDRGAMKQAKRRSEVQLPSATIRTGAVEQAVEHTAPVDPNLTLRLSLHLLRFLAEAVPVTGT